MVVRVNNHYPNVDSTLEVFSARFTRLNKGWYHVDCCFSVYNSFSTLIQHLDEGCKTTIKVTIKKQRFYREHLIINIESTFGWRLKDNHRVSTYFQMLIKCWVLDVWLSTMIQYLNEGWKTTIGFQPTSKCWLNVEYQMFGYQPRVNNWIKVDNQGWWIYIMTTIG